MLKRMVIKKFTVFQEEDFAFSPGLNIIVGENSAGKSHLLKLAYALIAASAEAGKKGPPEPTKAWLQKALAEKLLGVMRPETLGRLASRKQGRDRAEIALQFDDGALDVAFSFASNAKSEVNIEQLPQRWDSQSPLYLPTRELLTIFPGFVALYESRYLEFEETWRDTCILLGALPLKGARTKETAKLIEPIEAALGGNVMLEPSSGRFYLNIPKNGSMEMPLLAEGYRKLAMLARLIANGVIQAQGYVFWDEPEANLNPRLIRLVAEVIHNLSANGVQVFIATHSFFLLKELDILASSQPIGLRYIGLSRKAGEFGVSSQQSDQLAQLRDIVALDEELAQYDREMEAKHGKHFGG